MRMKLLTTLLLLAATTATAQSKFSKWEIGAGLGANIYQGDLTPKRLGSFRHVRPGILLLANYQAWQKTKLQLMLNSGRLYGNDASYDNPGYRQQRAFKFKTTFHEAQLKAVYQLHENYAEDASLLFPYIHAGIGVAYIRTAKDASALSNKLATDEPQILAGLALDDARKPNKLIVTIPVGFGVRKNVLPRWDAFAEANYRITFNDYIDGFSEAVNPKRKDGYYGINVGMIYKFRKDNSIGCPKYEW
jgi:hypothetical protein